MSETELQENDSFPSEASGDLTVVGLLKRIEDGLFKAHARHDLAQAVVRGVDRLSINDLNKAMIKVVAVQATDKIVDAVQGRLGGTSSDLAAKKSPASNATNKVPTEVPAKKAAANKAAGTKPATKKAAGTKAAGTKAATKKAPAKKAPAKKAPARQAAATKPATKKAPTKKAPAKKPSPKKAPANKTHPSQPSGQGQRRKL